VNLAKRIKCIRQSKQLSQLDMCDKLEVSQSTYSGYESEAGNLSFNTINKIALALGCNVNFLLDVKSECYDEEAWKTLPKI
jgi:transcriptional regulator with XRE-family HTH domain